MTYTLAILIRLPGGSCVDGHYEPNKAEAVRSRSRDQEQERKVRNSRNRTGACRHRRKCDQQMDSTHSRAHGMMKMMMTTARTCGLRQG